MFEASGESLKTAEELLESIDLRTLFLDERQSGKSEEGFVDIVKKVAQIFESHGLQLKDSSLVIEKLAKDVFFSDIFVDAPWRSIGNDALTMYSYEKRHGSIEDFIVNIVADEVAKGMDSFSPDSVLAQNVLAQVAEISPEIDEVLQLVNPFLEPSLAPLTKKQRTIYDWLLKSFRKVPLYLEDFLNPETFCNGYVLWPLEIALKAKPRDLNKFRKRMLQTYGPLLSFHAEAILKRFGFSKDVLDPEKPIGVALLDEIIDIHLKPDSAGQICEETRAYTILANINVEEISGYGFRGPYYHEVIYAGYKALQEAGIPMNFSHAVRMCVRANQTHVQPEHGSLWVPIAQEVLLTILSTEYPDVPFPAQLERVVINGAVNGDDEEAIEEKLFQMATNYTDGLNEIACKGVAGVIPPNRLHRLEKDAHRYLTKVTNTLLSSVFSPWKLRDFVMREMGNNYFEVDTGDLVQKIDQRYGLLIEKYREAFDVSTLPPDIDEFDLTERQRMIYACFYAYNEESALARTPYPENRKIADLQRRTVEILDQFDMDQFVLEERQAGVFDDEEIIYGVIKAAFDRCYSQGIFLRNIEFLLPRLKEAGFPHVLKDHSREKCRAILGLLGRIARSDGLSEEQKDPFKYFQKEMAEGVVAGSQYNDMQTQLQADYYRYMRCLDESMDESDSPFLEEDISRYLNLEALNILSSFLTCSNSEQFFYCFLVRPLSAALAANPPDFTKFCQRYLEMRRPFLQKYHVFIARKYGIDPASYQMKPDPEKSLIDAIFQLHASGEKNAGKTDYALLAGVPVEQLKESGEAGSSCYRAIYAGYMTLSENGIAMTPKHAAYMYLRAENVPEAVSFREIMTEAKYSLLELLCGDCSEMSFMDQVRKCAVEAISKGDPKTKVVEAVKQLEEKFLKKLDCLQLKPPKNLKFPPEIGFRLRQRVSHTVDSFLQYGELDLFLDSGELADHIYGQIREAEEKNEDVEKLLAELENKYGVLVHFYKERFSIITVAADDQQKGTSETQKLMYRYYLQRSGQVLGYLH